METTSCAEHGGEVATLREHTRTSAGYKATFAYEKLIQLYCQMAVNPKEAFVFGGDYRLSLIEGRLNKDEMVTNQADATFDDTTFAME